MTSHGRKLARKALLHQEGMRVLGGSVTEWTRREPIFSTRSGYPVEPRNLTRSFERITAAAQLRRIRLSAQRKARRGPGFRDLTWVGLRGLEPLTSSLSGKRS